MIGRGGERQREREEREKGREGVRVGGRRQEEKGRRDVQRKKNDVEGF